MASAEPSDGESSLVERLWELLDEQDRREQEEEEEEGLPWSDSKWIEGDSLAPPCPTEADAIEALLACANLREGDVLADLGAGDGRVCMYATAQYGVRSFGVEIEEAECAKFRRHVDELGLGDRVGIVHADLREVAATLDEATVVTVYLLPAAIEELRGWFDAALARGVRIVCNCWGLPWLEPSHTAEHGTNTMFCYDARPSADAAAAPSAPPHPGA